MIDGYIWFLYSRLLINSLLVPLPSSYKELISNYLTSQVAIYR